MPTYFVTLDEMMRLARTIDGREKRAVYWPDKDEFIVEYPVVNSAGNATGFVFRCEAPYEGIIQGVLDKNPAAKAKDFDDVVDFFDRVILGEQFKKVEGEYKLSR